MTEPATTPPASYCPRAAHTLQWGLHPDSSTQGWILRDGSSVVATLDGYPHGRTPVLSDEAREWADRILGTAQGWVEQPAGSGAYHRHGTVAAPEAAPPTGQADGPVCKFEEGCHRVVTCEPGCGTPWPTGQTGLRDLIAEALIAWTYRGKDPEHGGILETVRANAYSRADVVLSVLFGPIPAGTDTATWTAIRAIQLMNEAGRERDAATEAVEPHRLALSTALGLGTSAPWDAIRERAAELAGQGVAGGREAEAEQATESKPETPLEKRLRYSERRNDELRTECRRRGRNVLEQSEKIRALERQIDGIRSQLGAEILRAGEAEAELRRLAAETPGPETQGATPRRSRAARLLDAVTHSGPGYDLSPTAPAVVAEPGKENDAERIVAYRSDSGRLIHCLQHVPPPAARHADFHPVTSEDLPDGGICTYPDCGVDVLAQQPKEA